MGSVSWINGVNGVNGVSVIDPSGVGLSRCPEFNERPDLDLESLLHQAAFLTFDQAGYGIHGQIYRAAQGESDQPLVTACLYHAKHVVPFDLPAKTRSLFKTLSSPGGAGYNELRI
jgi:uncharacterized protein involved in type VI secretion and phage assembly